MLLLYKFVRSAMKQYKEIYIPLCFYFIIVCQNRLDSHCHLHSTMLLLYDRPCLQYVDDHPHLHSTMLLLYAFFQKLRNLSIRIYIPLCFYFISSRLTRTSSRRHLHSTMLLLYKPSASTPDLQIRNLHSTMLLLYRMFDKFGEFNSLFTFHYASTLSSPHSVVLPAHHHLHSTMLLLYNELSWFEECLFYHLHSTMLLLYERSCS